MIRRQAYGCLHESMVETVIKNEAAKHVVSEINAFRPLLTGIYWKTVSAVQSRLVLEKSNVESDIAQDSICQAMSAPPRLVFHHGSDGSEERKQCPQFHVVAAVSCC